MLDNKVWPKDKLGNEIREGKMILLDLQEPRAFFYVMGVTPASVIHGADGPIPVGGEIEVVLKFKLPFQPDMNQLHRAVVVEQPKQEDRVSLQ